VHGRDQAALAGSLRALLPGVRAWIATENATENATGDADGDATGDAPGSLPYESLLAAADPEPRDQPVSLDDPCLIMYTSGTTGRPKGAVLTHGNMTWACLNQILGFDIALDERTLALGPLFHIGGLNGTVNPTLLRGGCVVVVRSFDPAHTLAVIASQRVNSFFAVPTMLDAMAHDPTFTTRDLSCLRTVAAAGAPLPLPTLRAWLERGVTVQQAYGMTEAAPSGTVLESADAVRHAGSAGRAQFFTDVRVRRPDGSETAPGEVGEVVLSGPNIMAGYWNDPEQTAEVLRDGWYHSGDAGAVDEDGYLYIRDRYKDLIISGGENVYPAEVESALLELPGIVEAAVVGVPDEKWGEVGLAFLVGAERPAEQIRLSLRQHLAGFKIPRYVRFVDALPKTATGKIRKSELRGAATPPFDG
jgi:fatty-acyl-CoA synthase